MTIDSREMIIVPGGWGWRVPSHGEIDEILRKWGYNPSETK